MRALGLSLVAAAACTSSSPTAPAAPSTTTATTAPPTPSATTTSPTTTTTTPVTTKAPVTPATPLAVDAPTVAAAGPIGILVTQLLALPDGPLPGPEAFTLPPGSALVRQGRVKRFSAKIIDGSTVAHLRFSLKDGTWEGPAGNSAPDHVVPVVETIELEVKGTVAITPPASSTVIVTEPWRLPSMAMQGPVSVHHWGEGTYLMQGSAESPFWLTRSAGRAAFHVDEAARAAFDAALVDVTSAIAAGETDLVAIMAKRFSAQSKPVPPPPKPEPFSPYRAPPQPLAIYAFDAGHIDVMAPNSINVVLTVPMRLPKLFETHGMTRIITHFAHDHGQMAEPLQGPGFTISPGRYRIREENAHSAEDGDPREARFSAFSISIAPAR